MTPHNILFNQTEIQEKIHNLSTEITSFYKNEPLLILGVLKGAYIFTADLARSLIIPNQVDFVALSSYNGNISGAVQMRMDMKIDPENKNILIVEDICDSGKTLKYLTELLKTRGAKSVKSVVLIDKCFSKENYHYQPDWVGFKLLEEKWVVGYGLDYNEQYRNLADIWELK